MKKINIAIDGYSSCGKSTMARQLAHVLGYIYIDSGAMYRAITLYFLQQHIEWNNEAAVEEALQHIRLEFDYDKDTEQTAIFMNGENVTVSLRDMIVADKVSEVAALKPVRDFAVAQQRLMGARKGVVMDGRDIGTVVFPHAELKIFMTADIAVRVERRFRELVRVNPDITPEEVRDNLVLRDYIDSNRAISPLQKAPDAIVLDNTRLTMEEQLQFALNKVESLLQKV